MPARSCAQIRVPVCAYYYHPRRVKTISRNFCEILQEYSAPFFFAIAYKYTPYKKNCGLL